MLTNVRQGNMHASMASVSTPKILTAASVTLDTLEPSVNKVKLTPYLSYLDGLNFSYNHHFYGNTATATMGYCPRVANSESECT